MYHRALFALTVALAGCSVPFENAAGHDDDVAGAAGTEAGAAGAAGASAAGASGEAGARPSTGGGAGKGSAGTGSTGGAGAAGGGGAAAGGTSGGGTGGSPMAGSGGGAVGGAAGTGGVAAACTSPYKAELVRAIGDALPESASVLLDYSYCDSGSTVTRCMQTARGATNTCALTWSDITVKDDGSAATATLAGQCSASMHEYRADNGSGADVSVEVRVSGTVIFGVSTPTVDADSRITWGTPSSSLDVEWTAEFGAGWFSDAQAANDAVLAALTADQSATSITAELKRISLAGSCL